jgi:hypothetical protein
VLRLIPPPAGINVPDLSAATPRRTARPDRQLPPPSELTLTAGKETPETGQWIKDLAAERRTFADCLADRQNVKIPSEDPGYGDLSQAFPSWSGPPRVAILPPPKPEMLTNHVVMPRR